MRNGTVNAEGFIPQRRVIIYPDASHGFPFYDPHPRELAAAVNKLLTAV